MSIQDMQKAKSGRDSKVSQAKKDAEESAILRKYIVSMGHKDPGPGVSLIHLHALATVLKNEADKNKGNAETESPAEDASPGEESDPTLSNASDTSSTGQDPNLADQTEPGPASGNTAPPWLKGKKK